MIAYCYDYQGYFTGVTSMQRNPIRKNEFLVPANATLIAPPTGYDETKKPMFNQDIGTWILVDSPLKLEQDKQLLELTNEYGVNLYELGEDGLPVLRDEDEVLSETEAITKDLQIGELKRIMDSNIISKALEVTNTTSIESAQAFVQAFTLRMNNPEEYINDNLKVFYPIDNYNLYDILDTELKITDYYKKVLILLDKFRETEITNYLTQKSLL